MGPDIAFNDTWTEYELVGIFRSWQRTVQQLREQKFRREYLAFMERVKQRSASKDGNN